ncbi:NAD(P)-binding domain-containing protein [Halolamina rubra]|uniref:NAD(P)-binding domain-containing protein n=1 Tax=Halolamina rubra TaxID=1380430 RepID=UPI000679391E|nr:NAD(P)-binding domain-containing protein [Halolamina rubra]
MDQSPQKAATPTARAYDVAVVGGGASGLAAALFTARYGLDTVVFDRGQSAIRRSYAIENYLGLLGVTPEQFLRLARSHVAYEGAEVVDDLVTRVTEAGGGFRVETQDGPGVTADRVVAASAYNADYLSEVADGELHDEGDHPVDCDEATGRTAVDGLYVAGWLSGQPHQVLIAAGHGGRVGKELVSDYRSRRGHWDGVDSYWDWSVEADSYGDETWHEHVDEWFESTLPEDHEFDEERIERVREAVKAERLGFECSPAERDARLADARELLERELGVGDDGG